MIKNEKRLLPNEELFGMIEEALSAHYDAQFTVTGNSMWPLLRHGRDSVIVEKCELNDLKKGDVVLLKAAENRWLLHRITHIKNGQIQTAGDANFFYDGYFPREAVVAKVKIAVRKGKKHSLSSVFWRFTGRVWMALFPFRKIIFHVYSKIKHNK